MVVLSLKCSVALVLFIIIAYGQAPGAGFRFEVASVKPRPSPAQLQAQGLPRPPSNENAIRFQTYGSLMSLVIRAYRLEYYQRSVGPDWMNAAYFEVSANMPEGATRAQIPEMLQALLKERFQLAAHWQSEEAAVYILTVGMDGLKLKVFEEAADHNSQWSPKGAPVLRTAIAEGKAFYSQINGVVLFEAEKISIPLLARVISMEAGMPVIDRTGLSGLYEVSMPVPGLAARAALAARTSPAGSDAAADPSGVDLVKSAEKLGLKLEKRKAPIERLIVDHAERVPTEN